MVGEDPDRLIIQEGDFYAVIKTIEDMIMKLKAIVMESITSRTATVAADLVSAGVVKLQKIPVQSSLAFLETLLCSNGTSVVL